MLSHPIAIEGVFFFGYEDVRRRSDVCFFFFSALGTYFRSAGAWGICLRFGSGSFSVAPRTFCAQGWCYGCVADKTLFFCIEYKTNRVCV